MSSLLERLETDGRRVPMPASSSEITSLLLHLDPVTRARTLVVRFPPGFTRTEPGRYEVGEEMLVMEGSVQLNGSDLSAGTWCWVAPGTLRESFASDIGATVYAWFSGRNDWVPGQVGANVLTMTSALDAGPRTLREEHGVSASVAARTTVEGSAEVLGLRSLSWSRLELGQSAVVPEPALVRWDPA